MANNDAPRGLYAYGEGKEPRLTKYLNSTTTDTFRGDVVAMAANGHVHRIATTTGSANVIGVAATHVDASASSSAQGIWVWDDPDQAFLVQDDGDGATPAQTDVGATAPLIIGAGNTTTGQSIFELDVSNLGTAATDPLLIRGFLAGPKFSIAKNATYIVTLNRHLLKKGSSGI